LDHKPSSKVDYTAVSSLHDRFKPVARTLLLRILSLRTIVCSGRVRARAKGRRSVGVGGGTVLYFHGSASGPAFSGTREVPSPAALVCRPRTISAHDSHEWMTSVKHHAVSANCTRDSLELRSSRQPKFRTPPKSPNKKRELPQELPKPPTGIID
jgi:hypothetical protein